MRALTTSVNVRRLGQVGIDACLLALAYYLAYVLRFDSGIPHRYELLLSDTIVVTVAMKLAIFALFGLYSKLWRFVDQKDFETILKAVVVSSVGVIVFLFVFSIGKHDPPRGVLALDFLLSLAFVSGARFAVRWIVERPTRGSILERASTEMLIVGAGNGGQQVAFELRRNPGLRSAPVGFVDDDPRKQGMRIAGIKVLGATANLPRILDGVQPDEVIIAIPSAPGTLRQQVVTACRERGIPVRTLPTTFELLSGGVNLMRQVREVRVEDVLGRDPVRVEIDRVGAYLRGPHGARHGRGRIDRRRAEPPDRARGGEAARAGGELGERAVRDPPRARGGAPLRAGGRGARRLQGRDAHARGVRRAPGVRRLPRGRVQARAADGGEPGGGDPEQRGGHAHRRVRGRRGGRRAVRARLDGQGREPRDGDGRLEGARRVGHRGRAEPLEGHPLLVGAVRERARARRARWCRSSAARSPRAGRSPSPTRR